MTRPVFLTRTQRVMPTVKRAARVVLVLGCFALCGVMLALGV